MSLSTLTEHADVLQSYSSVVSTSPSIASENTARNSTVRPSECAIRNQRSYAQRLSAQDDDVWYTFRHLPLQPSTQPTPPLLVAPIGVHRKTIHAACCRPVYKKYATAITTMGKHQTEGASLSTRCFSQERRCTLCTTSPTAAPLGSIKSPTMPVG